MFLVGFQPAIMSNIKYDDNMGLVLHSWSLAVKMTKQLSLNLFKCNSVFTEHLGTEEKLGKVNILNNHPTVSVKL